MGDNKEIISLSSQEGVIVRFDSDIKVTSQVPELLNAVKTLNMRGILVSGEDSYFRNKPMERKVIVRELTNEEGAKHNRQNLNPQYFVALRHLLRFFGEIKNGQEGLSNSDLFVGIELFRRILPRIPVQWPPVFYQALAKDVQVNWEDDTLPLLSHRFEGGLNITGVTVGNRFVRGDRLIVMVDVADPTYNTLYLNYSLGPYVERGVFDTDVTLIFLDSGTLKVITRYSNRESSYEEESRGLSSITHIGFKNPSVDGVEVSINSVTTETVEGDGLFPRVEGSVFMANYRISMPGF